MGVLKNWSSIMESLLEIEVFEALMTVVPFSDKEEEQGHYVEAYMHNGFEGAFNKAFFEKEQERAMQREPYMGFYNEALSSGYEMLSAIEAPFIERGQTSYATAKKESVEKMLSPLLDEEMKKEAVFTLPEHALEYQKQLFADMEEPIAEYSEAICGALTLGEEGGMAERYTEAMEKAKVEKILSGAIKETKDARKHEIKVEMISREEEREDFDMDEMLEKITGQLCMMMAKGADGIYM